MAGAPGPRGPGSDYCGKELWGSTQPGRTQQEKVRQRPGSAETAGSPSSGCLARRPVAGGRVGQGVDALERAAAQPSPEARRPDPASAPAAAGKGADGGAGPGAPGPHKGKAPPPPGGVRDREVTVEKVGPANCQLPPSQFLRANALKQSPRNSSKSPHPCSYLPFYYNGMQKASF